MSADFNKKNSVKDILLQVLSYSLNQLRNSSYARELFCVYTCSHYIHFTHPSSTVHPSDLSKPMKPDKNKGNLFPAMPHLPHIVTYPQLHFNVTWQRRKITPFDLVFAGCRLVVTLMHQCTVPQSCRLIN